MLTCYDHLVENNKIEEIILSDVSNDYVLTSSREEAKLAIVEALKIQQFKQWAAKQSLEVDKLHPAVYGGHSGVVLEGDPGTGKTALIKTMLQACGYNLVLATDNNDYSGQKVYYQLTAANMDTVIDKAFQEGAILFADEINTFMTAELNEKLNAYLSGHALNKQPPRTPGFTVLAGMNPAYFNGRDELELAFRSRVRDVFVASYTHHDVEEIIDKKVSGANVRCPALAECRAKQGWWSQQQADKRQGLAEGGIRKMDECVAEAVEKSRNGHGFNRRTLGPK